MASWNLSVHQIIYFATFQGSDCNYRQNSSLRWFVENGRVVGQCWQPDRLKSQRQDRRFVHCNSKRTVFSLSPAFQLQSSKVGFCRHFDKLHAPWQVAFLGPNGWETWNDPWSRVAWWNALSGFWGELLVIIWLFIS